MQHKGKAMNSVKALMSGTPTTLSPTDTLQEALARMNNGACRELPVLENGLLVGILTDRDLRLAVSSPLLDEHDIATRSALLSDTQVSACMTTQVITTTSSAPAVEAAQALRLNRISAMPVVDEGRVVGMISATDFVDYFITESGRTES